MASANPGFSNFRFNEFGTRRRFSRDWQEKVVDILKGVMPIQLVGSSNVLLAEKYKLTSMGTMAHEYLQACQALGPRLRDSQKYALQVWAEEYEGDNGIALTDVIGMDAFLRDFNLMNTKLYDGLRHDSGDPMLWAEKAISHYKQNRIEPMTKTLVFSDGLTFPSALDIQQKLTGRIKTAFGIGTYLTNDMGVPALNSVLKMTECNGQPVAKISDSPGKSMCRDIGYLSYLGEVFSK